MNRELSRSSSAKVEESLERVLAVDPADEDALANLEIVLEGADTRSHRLGKDPNRRIRKGKPSSWTWRVWSGSGSCQPIWPAGFWPVGTPCLKRTGNF